jgi:hypothetical protein
MRGLIFSEGEVPMILADKIAEWCRVELVGDA